MNESRKDEKRMIVRADDNSSLWHAPIATKLLFIVAMIDSCQDARQR